jgi:hypothetical protein
MSNDVDWSSTSYACDTMQGTMKVHNICATYMHILIQLMVKHLACFCVQCFDGKWEECSNLKWIGD